MKTHTLLTRDEVSQEQVADFCRGRSTVELLRTVHTPDHSAAAVKRVTSELHERGVTDDRIAAFQSDWNELSVMPLSRRPTLEQALRRPRRWRRIHRTLQVVGLLDLAAIVLLLVVHGDVPDGAAPVLGLVGTVCWVPTVRAWLWTWPARILLLRPFGTKDVSKGLKRLVRRNVAFSGHVFTLADQHMKESTWVHVLESIPKSLEEVILFVVYLVRLVDTPRRKLFIKKAYHFRVLQRRLQKRVLLNSMWASSFDKIRKVRTSDRWWQRCVDLLTANVEVILVDLTLVKAGTRWELGKIFKEQLESKAIFVVQQDKWESARAVLADYWPADQVPDVFAYDPRGVPVAKPAFDRRLAEALALPRPPFTGKPRRDARYVMTALFGWVPGIGLPLCAVLWFRARRSEGRLRGRLLAPVMLALSIGLTAAAVVLPLARPSRSELDLSVDDTEVSSSALEAAGPRLEDRGPRLLDRPTLAGQTSEELDPRDKQAYTSRGNAKWAKGDLDGALADFTRAIEIDPRYAMAYYSRGYAKRAKGDLDGAIADYTKAIEIDPRDKYAYHNRGKAKRAKGDLDGAIADHTKEIEIDPRDAMAYYSRGYAKSVRGDLDEALADYTRAIAIDPRYAMAYYSRGYAKSVRGDLDGALADFTRAIEIDPRYRDAHLMRGYTNQAKGDLDGAIADYTKAIEINPRNADFYCSRGIAKWGGRDFTAAAADMKKAIDIDPAKDYARFFLFLCEAAGVEGVSTASEHLKSRRAARGSPMVKKSWVDTVDRFLGGELTAEELSKAAEDSPEKDRTGNRCEAFFYAGMLAWLRGDRTSAEELLRRRVATGKTDYTYYAARAVLSWPK